VGTLVLVITSPSLLHACLSSLVALCHSAVPLSRPAPTDVSCSQGFAQQQRNKLSYQVFPCTHVRPADRRSTFRQSSQVPACLRHWCCCTYSFNQRRKAFSRTKLSISSQATTTLAAVLPRVVPPPMCSHRRGAMTLHNMHCMAGLVILSAMWLHHAGVAAVAPPTRLQLRSEWQQCVGCSNRPAHILV
jgi:hypothetical protein